MQFLKGGSAFSANKVLDRRGYPFWQDESYDRCIRNEKELKNTINYILQNPVKAGLVQGWEDWPFTFLSPKYKVDE